MCYKMAYIMAIIMASVFRNSFFRFSTKFIMGIRFRVANKKIINKRKVVKNEKSRKYRWIKISFNRRNE